jgi:N-acetylmuramoyl-L-alanine amidase
VRPLPTLSPLPLPSRPQPPSTTTLRAGTRVVATVGMMGMAASAAYTVQPGDTLSGIASAQGTTVVDLATANGIDDPDRIVAGERLEIPATSVAEAASEAPAGGEVADLIDRVARAHGWSPRFVRAIAWQESGWDQSRVSSAGAVGIMQVLPGTGEFVSRELVGRELDLEDAHDNVEAGVVFLQHLWELTDGDVELTLAGYYQGLRSVAENGRYDDTERYVANVLALRDRF